MQADEIAQVRRFNRLVTQRVGALDDHFLGRDRPLGESRLLYEIGPDGADLRDLRQRLGLDSGYVSRLIKALQKKGLVRMTRDPTDQRVRQARLTPAGRREVRLMNRRSDEAASALLEALPAAQRTRMVAAMAEVHRLLQLAGLRIERVDPASPAARWCVGQYFDELDRRFESGFDPAASLSAEDRELVPPKGAFLVASIDGQPVACGAVKTISPGARVAQANVGCRRGPGTRDWPARCWKPWRPRHCALGMTTIRLETNHTLEEAIRLYRKRGLPRSGGVQHRSLRPPLVREGPAISAHRSDCGW